MQGPNEGDNVFVHQSNERRQLELVFVSEMKDETCCGWRGRKDPYDKYFLVDHGRKCGFFF